MAARTDPMDACVHCLVLADAPERWHAAQAQLLALGHVCRCSLDEAAALALLALEPFDALLVAAAPGQFDIARLQSGIPPAHADLLVASLGPPPWKPDHLGPALAAAQALARWKRKHADLARTVQAAEQRAAAASQELDSFAGRISHDLQAVLQVTEQFAAALVRTAAGKLDDKERHYLRRIVETNARGNRLVHDLLGFARLAVHPMASEKVDMGAVLDQARRTLGPESQGRHTEWTVGALPVVRGDAMLLHQVFVHLLSNAMKFTRERPVASIRVDAVASGAGIEFQVHDNGVGFDPAQAERLFRPFERLHDSERFEGNGMGLAHVRRIVQRHGGTVRAVGTPDGGALFAFSLPGPADPTEPPVAAPEASTSRASTALRILVVDDDLMVLASLRTMLELDGHEVTGAAGGAAGIEAISGSVLANAPFDIVITDFGMPHVDGLEVARAVKATAPGTRVIMLTGGATRDGGPAQWKNHVDCVLGKPPRMAHLREALKALAGHAPSTEEA